MADYVTLADGGRLHWRLDGPEGAPFLLLSNSLGTNMDMWAPQMPELTRHFLVLRYDSRGHGMSDAPAGPYSIDLLGRDAVGLLDALGIEKVRFAGLSKGGMVGQWLGANAPERLSHLVLCNTAAEMAPPEPWNARIALVKAQGMGAIVNGVVERWFTEPFRTTHPDAIAPITAMLHATPVEGYTACCAAVRDMDQRASLPRITVPTLVIGGRQDPATPIAKSHEMVALIPGAKMVELDAAHLSNIEQAEAFTAALLSFLKD
ncbi:3-oxoadipate enol-lactonase [Niveispirillum sp.]|uniref:3-oxoadipate enol-lactonase n=1 Tax=Niveispirillum sp. TaxID=1917217 RepID=UPI001B41D70F|nr:3-oxoadipate enol-lactonase [Niveispirillum sp.]MBP7337304.1 3-oxoadipate enol-lactonase [Niveispirillum sp.]